MTRAMRYLLIVLFVGSSGLVFGQNVPCSGNAAQVIQDAIKAASTLKPGDTRADVEREFYSDGGIMSILQMRYVYRECIFIKIDVEYSQHDRSPNAKDLFDPADRIVHISKPYLEYPSYN